MNQIFSLQTTPGVIIYTLLIILFTFYIGIKPTQFIYKDMKVIKGHKPLTDRQLVVDSFKFSPLNNYRNIIHLRVYFKSRNKA